MSRLILIGAGPIGVAACDAALADGVATSVAAVIDPDPAARDAAVHRFACAGFAGIEDLPTAAAGDVAILTFTSDAAATARALGEVLARGFHAVTTCEDLAFPDGTTRDGLDEAALTAERVVVVTGANPGFVMDRLPLAVAGAARNVIAVEVTRRVDTATRRGPLVAKTGRGLSPEAFAARVAAGTIGHRGLAASARLLAHGLGWPTHDLAETIDPVLADDGTVAGLHQTARLETRDGRRVVLDLTMSWEAADPLDRIVVSGDPMIRVETAGGYPGDEGTTAQVVRGLEYCGFLDPGFYLPTDLPLLVG